MPIQKEINLGLLSEVATLAEVNTATDTVKAVTPATLLKGQNNGVATLDVTGKIPVTQIPETASASGYDLFITSTNTSGSVFTDYSPSNRTITANGGAAHSTAIVYSGKSSSIRLNALGDYLSVGNIASLNLGSGNFVIGGRIRIESAYYGHIFSIWGNTPATQSIYLAGWSTGSGTRDFTLGVCDGTTATGIGSPANSNRMTDNVWHKWEVVGNGSTYKVYLNDVEILSMAALSQIAPFGATFRMGLSDNVPGTKPSWSQTIGNIDTFYIKLGTTVRPTNQDLDDALLGITPVFTGDSGSGGVEGLVPAPAIGDASKFLKGDGTWGVSYVVPSTITTASTTLSTADNLKAFFVNYTVGTHTVTIPSTLPAGFSCTFINDNATNYIQFSAGSGVTLNSGKGTKLQGGFLSCSLLVKSTGVVYLVGALST